MLNNFLTVSKGKHREDNVELKRQEEKSDEEFDGETEELESEDKIFNNSSTSMIAT